MANICSYSMKAVAKDRGTLERLLDILKYNDKEFFIYRVFEVSDADIAETEDGLFTLFVYGDVAWGIDHWFNTEEDFESKGSKNKDSHYISLDLLCKKLNMGVECWGEEPGCCFQQHYIVNHLGETTLEETRDWNLEEDEDCGNRKEGNGFGDEYDTYSLADEIYGEELGDDD